MDSYHNTTHSRGVELAAYNARARSQEEAIMYLFRTSVERLWAPSAVRNRLIARFGKRWPLTSVRRAMTNLTTAGTLEKTDQQVKGPYDRPEYQWRLPPKQGRLFGD